MLKQQKKQINELVDRISKLERDSNDCMIRVTHIEEKNDIFEKDIYQLRDDNKTLSSKQEIISNELQKRDSQTNNIKFFLIIIVVLIIIIFILIK